jgi:hypothetical protein
MVSLGKFSVDQQRLQPRSRLLNRLANKRQAVGEAAAHGILIPAHRLFKESFKWLRKLLLLVIVSAHTSARVELLSAQVRLQLVCYMVALLLLLLALSGYLQAWGTEFCTSEGAKVI